VRLVVCLFSASMAPHARAAWGGRSTNQSCRRKRSNIFSPINQCGLMTSEYVTPWLQFCSQQLGHGTRARNRLDEPAGRCLLPYTGRRRRACMMADNWRPPSKVSISLLQTCRCRIASEQKLRAPRSLSVEVQGVEL